MNERAVGAVANPADHRLAETIAVETGELLVEFREQAFSQPYSPWAVQDEADQMAHRFIVQRLADERPDDEVLSEEGHDDRARLGHDRVWIVDPLDGSNSYSDKGADDWAVHIALAIDGQPECGAVAMPSLGDVVSTAEPATVPPSLRERPLIVVSRQTWHWHGYELEAALDADVVGFGSAG
ncbi:MAG: inositol monophosphatase family protein, partial [Acidimicrobiales bacterium]